MKMSVLFCVAVAGLLNSQMVLAESGWLTDFEAAKKQASAEGKPILVNFSGSDWCGWCIRLDQEVFSQKDFQAFAGKEVVLLLLDFPASKQQPEALAAQNKKLAEKYGVRGFPTVLVLDAKGEVLGRTGYRPGGAEAYVKHVRELMGTK
jgi:protein disulfide-isomerase